MNVNNMEIAVPQALRDFFREHTRLALAFSGGCDSAYLLYAARACGVDVGAYYVHSCFQPAFELADAQRLAEQLICRLNVIEMDVLEDAQVRANPANRCYYCKRNIFGGILEAAKRDGYHTVIDGTNASDDASDRPGMQALRELRVLSPLRMCGIAKAQVRALSHQAGLFTWNKPAYACLATRIPTGMAIEKPMLERVERAEMALSNMGFSDFRVRMTERGARLELCEGQLELLMRKRRDVLVALEADFAEITLNLRLRREMET